MGRLNNEKLTVALVAELRRRARAGEAITELAREVDCVCESAVYSAIRGRTWARVDEPPVHGDGQRAGERNGASILTRDMVVTLRKRARAGETIADLSRALGIGADTARLAVRGETWTHVEEQPVESRASAVGEGNPAAKLTAARVAAARRMARGGVAVETIASAYGVTTKTITRAVRGETWRHVDEPPLGARPEPDVAVKRNERHVEREEREDIGEDMREALEALGGDLRRSRDVSEVYGVDERALRRAWFEARK